MKLRIILFLSFSIIIYQIYANEKSINDLFEANKHYKIHDFSEALQLTENLENFVKDPNEKVLVFLFKSKLHFEMKNYRECIEYCNLGLKFINRKNLMLRSKLKLLYILKGLSYYYLGDMDKALEMFPVISELDIQYQLTPLGYRAKYFLLMSIDNHEIAVEDIRNIRKEIPEGMLTYFIESYYYFYKIRNYEKALETIQLNIDMFDRFESIDCRKSDRNLQITSSLLLESLCYYQLNKLESAIKSYKLALSFYDYGNNLNELLDHLEFKDNDINILIEISKL